MRIGAGLVDVTLLLAGIVALVARAIVAVRGRDRRAAFTASLPQALQLLASSLRSGHGMMQALDAVAVSADEPARGSSDRVIIKTRLGRDLTEAIRQLAERIAKQRARMGRPGDRHPSGDRRQPGRPPGPPRARAHAARRRLLASRGCVWRDG